MTYLDPARRRRRSASPASVHNDVLRLVTLLLFFAALSLAVVRAAPPVEGGPGLPDWHGNVAASAGTSR